LRSGRTIYVRLGDGPLLALAGVALAALWLGALRRRHGEVPGACGVPQEARGPETTEVGAAVPALSGTERPTT
jgi:hypothetical protein